MHTDYIRKVVQAVESCGSDEELVAFLQDLLSSLRTSMRMENDPSQGGLFVPNNRKKLEEVRVGGETFQLEYVRCGKPDCPCRTGKGHGPYWYAYRSVKGKTKSRYVGKKAPPHLEAARRAAQEAGLVQAQAEQGKGLDAALQLASAIQMEALDVVFDVHSKGKKKP